MRYLVKFTDKESRMEVAGPQEAGNGELVFNGYSVSVWEDEKVLEISGGNGCTTM